MGLRRLDDPAFADEAAELVKVFADAGGEAVGEELDKRLQEELAFWQATAPSLSQGGGIKMRHLMRPCERGTYRLGS